jgi:DnaJ-class molecular chaperone
MGAEADLHDSMEWPEEEAAVSNERTAAIHEPPTHEMTACEDCLGTGVDPGSLHEPEECKACGGYGDVIAPEEVERIADVYRKPMKREESFSLDWYEERKWIVGE